MMGTSLRGVGPSGLGMGRSSVPSPDGDGTMLTEFGDSLDDG